MNDRSGRYPLFSLILGLMGVAAVALVVCLWYWEDYQAAGLFAIVAAICFGIPAHAELRT